MRHADRSARLVVENLFGGATASPFGAATTSTSAFGSQATPSSSVGGFGSPAFGGQNQSGGGFGSPAGFGAKPCK